MEDRNVSNHELVESLQQRTSNSYSSIGLDHLIVFTVDKLSAMNVDLSFENITAAAYKMFPGKFSMSGYPEYPDGKRVHDAIFHCTYKTKRWILGKKKHGYLLSEKGRIAVQETEKMLDGEVTTSRKGQTRSQTRTKEALFVEIRATAAFKKFSAGVIDTISDAEFCYMLQGTLDTSCEALNRNMDTLLVYANDLNDSEMKSVLSALQKHFKHLLTD